MTLQYPKIRINAVPGRKMKKLKDYVIGFHNTRRVIHGELWAGLWFRMVKHCKKEN